MFVKETSYIQKSPPGDASPRRVDAAVGAVCGLDTSERTLSSPPAAPTSCMPTLHTVDQTCVYLRGERRRGRRTATKRSLCSSRTKMRRRRKRRMTTRRKGCFKGTAAQGTTGR